MADSRMQTTEGVLAAHYIQHIADQLAVMGVGTSDWLARHGLTEAMLDQAALTVSWDTFRQLFLDAKTLTREPALGFLVGERLRINTHGILGYAAMNSGSVRQVVEVLERFVPLRLALVSVRHGDVDGEMRVYLEERFPLGDVRHLLMEAVMVAIKNVLDFITLGACEVAGAMFAFPAVVETSFARTILRCPVSYGQSWTGLRLPLSVVDTPLKTADPVAFEHASRLCERELARLTADPSMAARVRTLLLARKTAFPSLAVTARMFHMTPRTLHRRLVAEGTSFQRVLDEVRHSLAVEYLKSEQLTIQELAYTLGYNDTANFRRAFKRWTGVAPSRFR